jgi:hypothetical protein
MPKRTREDKILAQQRKIQKLLATLETPQPLSRPRATTKIKQPQITNIDRQEAPKMETDSEKVNFVRDFKKSLLLILGIIALEIVIYFASINNVLRF